VLQTLFLSAEGLANCPQESIRFWIWRFVSDQALAVVASNILHLCISPPPPFVWLPFIFCEGKLRNNTVGDLIPWLVLLVHSFILLAQAITLSTCIVAHNNALLALLVSNNFAEIKSNVFKRYSMDNVHSLVYFGMLSFPWWVFSFLDFSLLGMRLFTPSFKCGSSPVWSHFQNIIRASFDISWFV